MRESSCSVGGGVDSSNHQFPRQTDRGQEHRKAAIRLQVRLRIGRLTLGLTVADRWECSQATGLPAWRHQDLHITANRATRYHEHSNSRIGTPVLVQAGPGCKNMYTATQGAFV